MQAELLGAGYADRLHLDRGEADPLDLASANERLYNSVFPGYNNAVRFHPRLFRARLDGRASAAVLKAQPTSDHR